MQVRVPSAQGSGSGSRRSAGGRPSDLRAAATPLCPAPPLLTHTAWLAPHAEFMEYTVGDISVKRVVYDGEQHVNATGRGWKADPSPRMEPLHSMMERATQPGLTARSFSSHSPVLAAAGPAVRGQTERPPLARRIGAAVLPLPRFLPPVRSGHLIPAIPQPLSCAFHPPPCSGDSDPWPSLVYTITINHASVVYTFKILVPQVRRAGRAARCSSLWRRRARP